MSNSVIIFCIFSHWSREKFMSLGKSNLTRHQVNAFIAYSFSPQDIIFSTFNFRFLERNNIILLYGIRFRGKPSILHLCFAFLNRLINCKINRINYNMILRSMWQNKKLLLIHPSCCVLRGRKSKGSKF